MIKYLIIFLLSFSSMSLQFLLGTMLSTYTSGDLFIYPISIGMFLLGMGLGTINTERYSLIKVEYLIILSAATLMTATMISFKVDQFPWYSILFGISSSFIIGFFSGKELPIILKECESKNNKKILFFDYLASLISSIIFILFLNSFFSFITILLIIILINSIVILFIKIDIKNLINFSLWALLLSNSTNIDNLITKINYNIGYNDELFINKKTKYSKIIAIKTIQEQQENVKLYLNNSIQYHSNISGLFKNDIYHSSLINPLLIFNNLNKILILGGGDGLPSYYLNHINQNFDITLVDIDREWVELNKNHHLLLKINNNSLNMSNQKIIIKNAFDFIKNNKETFDFIIIDFPEFESLESLRIHSKEFINELKGSLSEKGIIVYQEDKKEFINVKNSILYTAQINGFYPIIGEWSAPNSYREITQYLLFKNEKMKNNYLEHNNSILNYEERILNNLKTKETTYFNPYIMKLRILNFLGYNEK